MQQSRYSILQRTSSTLHLPFSKQPEKLSTHRSLFVSHLRPMSCRPSVDIRRPTHTHVAVTGAPFLREIIAARQQVRHLSSQ